MWHRSRGAGDLLRHVRADRARHDRLLPGSESVLGRDRQGQRDHQLPSGDRTDRPAGLRSLLCHRPAQCHGGREVGGLANALAAHMRFDDPDDRAALQAFWQSPTLAPKPGLKAVDLFDAMLDGRVKALWIVATNPAASLPRADRVRAALAACSFVVVSDCWPTDTSAYAHVVLPAAGWGEKDGTVTNSERRISRQRPFRKPPGEAQPDWWQFAEVGRRMGWAEAFAWQVAAAVFQEH